MVQAPRPNASRSENARENQLFFVKNKNYLNFFFLDMPSSYAKIMEETNFGTQEFPRSGSKAEDGEKRRRRGERD